MGLMSPTSVFERRLKNDGLTCSSTSIEERRTVVGVQAGTSVMSELVCMRGGSIWQLVLRTSN